MQTNHPSGPNPTPAALSGMMTPDEDEQAEQIADKLDAEHAAYMAAGNPPRVIDPGMGKTGVVVPVEPTANQ